MSLSVGTIPCCICGIAIEPNSANMCVSCLKQRVDVTEGVAKEAVLFLCKSCGRYANGIDAKYENVDLETSQMLTLCLKGIQGIGRGQNKKSKTGLKLLDAKFIWTEPHSRRVKVFLDLEKEVPEYNSVKIRQGMETEFYVKNKMCEVCRKETINQNWSTVVQLRQHADHKKTLLAFESELHKMGLMGSVLSIDSKKDGLDFYFANKHLANKFVDTITSLLPVLKKGESSRHMGTDIRNNVANLRISILIEISPICRMDCVLIPKQYSGTVFSNTSNFVGICDTVKSTVHLVDPLTGNGAVAKNTMGLEPFLSAKRMIPFVVLDVPEEEVIGRKVDYEHLKGVVEVARESDLGNNDTVFRIPSHLSSHLQAGDIVLGYDFTSLNLSVKVQALIGNRQLPQVVLVRKK